MTNVDFKLIQQRIAVQYQSFGLEPFLRKIRENNRYKDRCGINILTNAEFSSFSFEAVSKDLCRAAQATHSFKSSLEHRGQQGLSFGLNPYTDWSFSQLKETPRHWLLIMGLDWYSISGLPKTPEKWFFSIVNPFGQADRYWSNLWTWIMGSTKVTRNAISNAASTFINEKSVGIVFHNWIPYLRPATIWNTARDWPRSEWAKLTVRSDISGDLKTLRQAIGDCRAYCTNATVQQALQEVGFSQALSMRMHPSRGLPRCASPTFN